MMSLRQIGEWVSRWIDSVAETLVAWIGALLSPRTVRFVEQDDGAFAVQPDGRVPPDAPARVRIADGRLAESVPDSFGAMMRGSRAELVLDPARFLFRPLELPRQAAEFLDGVVRAQIDRLTPWSAKDAAFGWSAPADAGADRIMVTVAATARALVAPLTQAMSGLGVQSIGVFTRSDAAGAAPIKVYEERAHGALDVRRVRRVLLAVLVLSAVAATSSVGASVVAGINLGAQQEDLARRIAERRNALRAGRESADVPSPLRQLERRKHETPSSVLVLEVLSQILPDHTYVTELRIEGDKLRVIGLTRDAPALIRLMEQSPQFTRATFFAPTTRSPSDPGERFHIEARIEPVFGPRS
jgi:general secretion pathway protein L